MREIQAFSVSPLPKHMQRSAITNYQNKPEDRLIRKVILREPIIIAMATDDSYRPYLMVTLQSVLEHISNDEIYELIILYSGANVSEFRASLSNYNRPNFGLRVVDMRSYRHGTFYTSNHISLASYDRLYLPALLTQYNKVLYLDCDLIVLTDIAPLFRTEMGINYLAGVRDECFVHMENDLLRMARNEHLTNGATNNRNHINAGVLLMNLQKIRETKMDKAWLNFARERNLVFHDQSVLNILCEGRITLLDEAWNFQTHNRLNAQGLPTDIINASRQRIQEGNYKIIHYSTPEKPWVRKCSPLSNLWWFYAKRTPLYFQLCDKYIRPYLIVKWRAALFLIFSLIPIKCIHRFCLSKIRRSYLKPICDYVEWLEMQNTPRI